MTLDKSLQIRRGSVKNRNVLRRSERITKLKESERWDETMSVLGLPKVRVIKLTIKKKKKKKEEEGAEGAVAAEGAAPLQRPGPPPQPAQTCRGRQAGRRCGKTRRTRQRRRQEVNSFSPRFHRGTGPRSTLFH